MATESQDWVSFKWWDYSGSVQIQYLTESALEAEMGEISDLLDRPWWKRVWIVQEAVLAKKLRIMCSEDEASWGGFEKYARSLDTRNGNSWYQENEFWEPFKMHPFPHAAYSQRLRSRSDCGAAKGTIYEF